MVLAFDITFLSRFGHQLFLFEAVLAPSQSVLRSVKNHYDPLNSFDQNHLISTAQPHRPRVLIWTVFDASLLHPVPMRMNDMTAKQLFAVPCPRCGVAMGSRCLEPSGTLRAEPHVDRRLAAIEAVENKRESVRGSGMLTHV
jgi:hypothetical protein